MLPNSYLAHLDEVLADFQQKVMQRWRGRGGVADLTKVSLEVFGKRADGSNVDFGAQMHITLDSYMIKTWKWVQISLEKYIVYMTVIFWHMFPSRITPDRWFNYIFLYC